MVLLQSRVNAGFITGTLIGILGGLIGLGGAEFRLPILVGFFAIATLQAVILNKAVSLVVVTCSLIFRMKAVAFTDLIGSADVIVNLLAGSLLGAWYGAGYVQRLSAQWLNRIILVLLIILAGVMGIESLTDLHAHQSALFQSRYTLFAAGILAGLIIGVVAAVLGVAGGELLIPTGVLLYGLDIKLAGSVSLAVSLPTMLTGFIRYRQADAFRVLKQEQSLLWSMALGSVAGSSVGAQLLGMIPSQFLLILLSSILFISAIKVFRHSH